MKNLENIKSRIKSVKVESFIKLVIFYQILLSLTSLIIRFILGYTDYINTSFISLFIWIPVLYFVLNRFKNGGILSRKVLQFWYVIALYLIQFLSRTGSANELYFFTLKYSLIISPVIFTFSGFALIYVNNYHPNKIITQN